MEVLMRAGVVVTAHPGVEDLAVQAEELGLHSFWVNDTPMVHGDPFVALGLCAKATSRIRLGIGVTSPALRSAPAAASAFASLNALAPGRIICGIGTGNTARRTLGMRPTTAATLESFTTALQKGRHRRTAHPAGDRPTNRDGPARETPHLTAETVRIEMTGRRPARVPPADLIRDTSIAVKGPAERDQVPPGPQVPSSASRREGPDLRSAP
ncbi:LLM class flavin-dependent oxidoreductase [Nonomuraea sp. NPDC050786]|uniref:LLM class flavin-dependent oxidoreductase n=1 Tax=Nonomuraea sp. NPDC050786 TaxID=3154840 RepID=UPI0033FF6E06